MVSVRSAAVVALALVLAGREGRAEAQATAQATAQVQAEPDGLRVSLLTFSPSAHPFLALGHNALWIHDPRLRGDDVDLVYNFGTFAFGSPWVVVDFARGRLRYWLSLATLDWTLDTYRAEGRGVRAQELVLSPDEADRLERALLEAARPENRDYAYGYIQDNCATRVRDAIDQATGGALRVALAGPGDATYRAAVARMLGDRLLLGEAIDAALGPAVDRPMNAWQAAFLPDRFAVALARAARPAGEPLVKRERTLVEAGRWFPEGSAPERRPAALVVGSLGAALLALGGRRAAAGSAGESSARRRVFGAAVAVVGVALGGVGTAILLLGLVHPLLGKNVNVLHTLPLALWLGLGGWRVARGEPGAARRALPVAALGLLTSGAGLLLSLAGLTPQPWGALAALAFPLWIGLVAGLSPGAGAWWRAPGAAWRRRRRWRCWGASGRGEEAAARRSRPSA
jgi:hypothetical protein